MASDVCSADSAARSARRGADRLAGSRDDTGRQREDDGDGADHQRAMPPRELPQLVRRARRPRRDRLVLQVPPDVRRQLRRRRVAPRLVLLQRLGRRSSPRRRGYARLIELSRCGSSSRIVRTASCSRGADRS